MIYLNHAATAHPRPARVLEAVARSLESPPQEPGRSGFRDPLMDCRRAIATLYGLPDPLRVVLTTSATLACNQVIFGLALPPGSHMIASCLEHNSVLRPLRHLVAHHGCELTVLAPGPDGRLSEDRFAEALRPGTRLIACLHVSNVTGAILPVEAIAAVAAEHGIGLLIDDAQGAGVVPLDAGRLPGRCYVVGAGHKGLMGPPGTGFLLLPEADGLRPFLHGGTGVHSDEPLQPKLLPHRLEAGTPNTCGFEGLCAGVLLVMERPSGAAGAHRQALSRRLLERMPAPWRVIDSGVGDDLRGGVVSLVHPKRRPSEVGLALQEIFGIETRWGLHCAPLAHRHLGTHPAGTLRVSVGETNSPDDIDNLLTALVAIEGLP